jgi:ABC-2 type transport system ATP-binding protein
LLRTIAGLQPADAGRVDVIGQRLDRNDGDSMRHVGFTPDTPPAYEQLTVRKFLQFVARGYDLSKHEVDERIDFWLEKVWLTEKADQKIGSLSRGMKQRVGIARTLLPNPHVILLDEPAAGLDPRGRVQFRELLNDLRRQGKAVIVSSHILADMDEYCSHIGVMSHGRLVRFGTVREISQAVGATGDGTRATYRVRLAKPVVGLAGRVEAIDGVESVAIESDHAFTLTADPGDDAAARLLADLIRAGLFVSAFGEVKGDLEQAYLSSGVHQVD